MQQQFFAVITLLNEIFTLGWKVYDLYKEAKKKGWIVDGRTLSTSIKEAKADEERAALARRLFTHGAG